MRSLRSPLLALQIAAVISDQDFFLLDQFDSGFEVGGSLKDGKGDSVFAQRTQRHLGLRLVGPNALARKFSQLAKKIAGEVVADVDQPGQQFGTLATKNVRKQENQFSRKHR